MIGQFRVFPSRPDIFLRHAQSHSPRLSAFTYQVVDGLSVPDLSHASSSASFSASSPLLY